MIDFISCVYLTSLIFFYLELHDKYFCFFFWMLHYFPKIVDISNVFL